MGVLQCQLSVSSLFFLSNSALLPDLHTSQYSVSQRRFYQHFGTVPMHSNLPPPLCQDYSQPYWNQQQKWPHIFPNAQGWAGDWGGSVTALRMFSRRVPWENYHLHIPIYHSIPFYLMQCIFKRSSDMENIVPFITFLIFNTVIFNCPLQILLAFYQVVPRMTQEGTESGLCRSQKSSQRKGPLS